MPGGRCSGHEPPLASRHMNCGERKSERSQECNNKWVVLVFVHGLELKDSRSLTSRMSLRSCGQEICVHVQGHHPFAYALAELIDNSLRATRHRAAAGQPRTIQVRLRGRLHCCTPCSKAITAWDTSCDVAPAQLHLRLLSIQFRQARIAQGCQAVTTC